MAEISVREALGKTLLELGGKVPNMLVINADLRNSVKTTYFMNEYPERTIEVGIAEQNMIGVAAGLAMMGFIPFTVTFARFASKRAADQISLCVDYCKTNVRIIGAYAGIFTGCQGATQQMISDTAAMRSMPNMTVIDTADVHEVRAVLHYAVEHEGPLYIRVGRDPWPVVFDESYKFELGKGSWLREGSDVVLMNSGLLLPYAIEAAEMLQQEGIDAGVDQHADSQAHRRRPHQRRRPQRGRHRDARKPQRPGRLWQRGGRGAGQQSTCADRVHRPSKRVQRVSPQR